jgi:sec-independent protein translocase protein TatB
LSSVGLSELFLLFIIGLLILGPERLPRVASQIGRWVGRARRTANQLRYQLEREIALADIEQKPKTRPQPKAAPAAEPAATTAPGAATVSTGEPAVQPAATTPPAATASPAATTPPAAATQPAAATPAPTETPDESIRH